MKAVSHAISSRSDSRAFLRTASNSAFVSAIVEREKEGTGRWGWKRTGRGDAFLVVLIGS